MKIWNLVLEIVKLVLDLMLAFLIYNKNNFNEFAVVYFFSYIKLNSIIIGVQNWT